MAELMTKLHCKKNGTTEEIAAYSTLDEVQNQGIGLTINGIDAYVKYGPSSDANASQLNCKVPNNSTNYRVLTTADTRPQIRLTAYRNNETEMQTLSSMRVAEGEICYINNENAPTIEGYDFVMAIPNNFAVTGNTDVRVYYIPNTVANRTQTSWARVSATGDLYLTDSFNTYSATEMENMFYSCSSLTAAPKLNTSNVTDMLSMFYSCSALTTVPAFDTSNVTYMGSMFHMCRALTTVPEFNTSKVNSMANMFRGCSALTTVPEFNTSKVTNMSSMFYSCRALTTVPEFNTSKVTDMANMFRGCSALTSIGGEIDMSSCTRCDSMFKNCPATGIKLKNVPSTLDLSNIGTTNYTVVNYI